MSSKSVWILLYSFRKYLRLPSQTSPYFEEIFGTTMHPVFVWILCEEIKPNPIHLIFQ